ncbi:MAG TPA: hypothetical protein VNQ74_08745, partial [Burkholderiaceae bacterium]|nr:hypothetical protein [Burkholderiaceae bacterium]
LFGDMEYVFAAHISERVAHVIRMVDGKLVDKRELPQNEWLLATGRNVAEVGPNANREKRATVIRVTDIFSGDVLFDREFSLSSRISVVEPDSIVVMEPSGQFLLIDARDGSIKIEKQLAPMEDMTSLSTMVAGNKLFVFVGAKSNEQQFKPLIQQPDYPMLNGLAYAFDRTTSEPLWPGPAVLRNRGLVLSQPTDVPLLVFADRKTVRDAASGGGTNLRLLCLDQNTGETVYRNEVLPDTSITRFRVRGERGSEHTVAIEMNAGKIQLTLTDEPRPPAPPANDDLETPRQTEQRGLRAIGQRMSGALQGTFGDPAEQARLQQLEMIEAVRKRAIQAREDKIKQFQVKPAEKQKTERDVEATPPPENTEPFDDD